MVYNTLLYGHRIYLGPLKKLSSYCAIYVVSNVNK